MTGILQGPRERPRFQDNTNSFLGEDTVVEPGIWGMNGTWRPVGGGQEADWTEGRPNGSWISLQWYQQDGPSTLGGQGLD